VTSKADQNRSTAWTRASVKKKLIETVGEPTIEYDPEGDGNVYTFPHPLFYDAATKKALGELKDDDEDGTARVLLGDEQYDKFVAAGGTSDEITRILIITSGETRESLANGTPTRGAN
jgi:hypothetical protein